MYQINIATNIYSIIVCLILAFYLLGHNIADKKNRYFLSVCVFNILFILGDTTDWACQGFDRAWYPAALHTGQLLYYVILAPFMYCFAGYICTYISEKAPVSSNYRRIITGLCVLHLAGALITPFTGFYYVITDANEYMRGDFVFVASILPVSMYLIVMILALKYRKYLQPRVVAALLSYVFLPLVGQVIQNVFRGVGTLIPAITLSMLFIFVNIQLDRDIETEKQKRELAEAKTAVMLSQIQPHFLYNVLAVIRRLCEKDPQSAQESISAFSVFLRANMDSLTNNMPLPFEKELEHTESYLQLERQRFGDELKVVYDIETEDFCIPALTLQPIVENAVRHGIRRKEEGGTVTIHTVEQEKSFLVIVEDDGVGFETVAEYDQSSHIGIANVRMRLETLCKGSLKIESAVGQGTKVTMEIPKEA